MLVDKLPREKIINNFFPSTTSAAIIVQCLTRTLLNIHKKPYFCCYYCTAATRTYAKMGNLARFEADTFYRFFDFRVHLDTLVYQKFR